MKFASPAGVNPIDRAAVIGQGVNRIDGQLKVSGGAKYGYEHVTDNCAYGYVVGAGVGKGKISALDDGAARSAPGVLGIVSHVNSGKLGKGKHNFADVVSDGDVQHYHQAVAIVIAETFEQARYAASLLNISYTPGQGKFDLAAERGRGAGEKTGDFDNPGDTAVGEFERAFVDAPVKVDEVYTTPDQAHAMMEPHASIAEWSGDELTLWTTSQMIDWNRTDLAKTLDIPKEKVRIISPFIGGGFGGKLFLRADAVLAALGARETKRRVKVALQRPLMFNNTTHRPATIQHIRIGAGTDGKITAISHESWSGNVEGGRPEFAVGQTRLLYAGANRETKTRLAHLDLPEGNAMRAPGEAPGMMALEIAMDEMAEKLKLDPVEFRIRNDTQVDPEKPERKFSLRNFTQVLRTGADNFGWSARKSEPASVRDGEWLIGMGMAAAFRNHISVVSRARVRLGTDGHVTVETDMTDIGTGSYTIIAQTAAEMLGVPLSAVTVRLGDSDFPVSCGSGGQFGAINSTSGVYAACEKLRSAIAEKLNLKGDVQFGNGKIIAADQQIPLAQATAAGEITAEDGIEFGDQKKTYQESTFGAHFCEVAVNEYTAETRVRRMLAVCAAGRILNPKTARSQVIGAMTMGVGAALMEDLFVDKKAGFFANHDLAAYEVPVHLDIPKQDVIFIDEVDSIASPMKGKGIGELGLCGSAAAVANAIYNATGVRVREYPVTIDKLIHQMPMPA